MQKKLCSKNGKEFAKQTDFLLWHKRLGHPSTKIVTLVLNQCDCTDSHDDQQGSTVCSICQMTKSHTFPFIKATRKVTEPQMIVDTDICDPAPIISNSGYHWYVSFIDEFFRLSWIFFKDKRVVIKGFMLFKNQVELQSNKKVKML